MLPALDGTLGHWYGGQALMAPWDTGKEDEHWTAPWDTVMEHPGMLEWSTLGRWNGAPWDAGWRTVADALETLAVSSCPPVLP